MNKKIRVLIVEDNEDEREFIRDGFIGSGLYEVIGEAANGDEMLRFLQQQPASMPDVIFSDLNMPVRNGYEVIVDVKSNSAFSHIPIVILTTAASVIYADRCKKLGACAYFTKPDTYLEYTQFGKKIYPDIKACLDSTLQCSSISAFLQNLLRKCAAALNLTKLIGLQAPSTTFNLSSPK